MDNTWFIQMSGLRLLMDPWLEGAEVDYFPWFNKQWHRTKPIDYSRVPPYDYVLITQKYPDHFHQNTLLKLQPRRIIAPVTIVQSLRKLLPNAEVCGMGKENPVLEIGGVQIRWYPTSRKIDPIYDAFMLQDDVESVFLATHGYFINNNKLMFEKPVKLLISPFNHYQLPFYLGGTVSPGIEGLIHLTEKLDPKHIVSTHDEDKHARGLVSRMAKVKRVLMSDLSEYEIFRNRILELNHYEPLQL